MGGLRALRDARGMHAHDRLMHGPVVGVRGRCAADVRPVRVGWRERRVSRNTPPFSTPSSDAQGGKRPGNQGKRRRGANGSDAAPAATRRKAATRRSAPAAAACAYGPGRRRSRPGSSREIADLGHESVQRNQWMAKVAERAQAAAERAVSVARKGGLSESAVEEIRSTILGVTG